jgi:hypothetical protein
MGSRSLYASRAVESPVATWFVLAIAITVMILYSIGAYIYQRHLSIIYRRSILCEEAENLSPRDRYDMPDLSSVFERLNMHAVQSSFETDSTLRNSDSMDSQMLVTSADDDEDGVVAQPDLMMSVENEDQLVSDVRYS